MEDNRVKFQMRAGLILLSLVVAALATMVPGQAQWPVDPKLDGQLKQLFPAAVGFSPKAVDPPHYKVYASNPLVDPDAFTGLAFWTTEVEPLERGYDGPIKILVGMDTKGILTGVIVALHHEPYGDFSVDPPQFAAQFKGKSIRDPFKVGVDIDAVSRATITITSAVRAIRTSARRIATRLLVPPK
jgi:NosR/NirI family transcriptional regulator, nitrous oxide reductase regulator